MKWSIPAKTFLLGEYAAITGASAIVLTTFPCFELALTVEEGIQGIHPASPAGQWWAAQGHINIGLSWHDPYQGRGGMGASSAQFLGAYLASMYVKNKSVNQHDMLEAYLQSTWSGEGVHPSGYDVLAQSLNGCVYINQQKARRQIYAWPFEDLAFLLLHTGQKLATHEHLQTMSLPKQVSKLVEIVEIAKNAFEHADSNQIVEAVNTYHQQLANMNLVADHSLEHITSFKEHVDVLAVKGCGAMGADILLLLVREKNLSTVSNNLSAKGWNVMASSADLHREQPLIENNPAKKLEISHLSGIIPTSLGR